jgi:hypothetical protein
LLTARFYLAAGVVGDRLYAVGGEDNINFLNTVEAYDSASNTWSTKAPMPTRRFGLAAGVAGRSLYAIGGKNVNSIISNAVEAFKPRRQ